MDAKPALTPRRALFASKRATVDGIATHCGFVENGNYLDVASRKIQASCDRFFADRGMVWVQSIGDYVKPA